MNLYEISYTENSKILNAIARVHAALGGVAPANGELADGVRYARLIDILKDAQPFLAAEGLMMLQRRALVSKQALGASTCDGQLVDVLITTLVHKESGESTSDIREVRAPSNPLEPESLGLLASAETYARRNALKALLAIHDSTELPAEDGRVLLDEAESVSKEQAALDRFRSGLPGLIALADTKRDTVFLCACNELRSEEVIMSAYSLYTQALLVAGKQTQLSEEDIRRSARMRLVAGANRASAA